MVITSRIITSLSFGADSATNSASAASPTSDDRCSLARQLTMPMQELDEEE
jgi:hypothetical protein